MGGSITYPDGRYFVIGYKFVYYEGEFEPLPKQPKPAWSVW